MYKGLEFCPCCGVELCPGFSGEKFCWDCLDKEEEECTEEDYVV